MSSLGVHLTLNIGRTTLPPAPPTMVEALESVQVDHRGSAPAGFQMTFQIGRHSAVDLTDFHLLRHPDLKPFSRVQLIVRFAVKPQVLIDGFITNIQMSPSSEPGQSTLVVTGEDISLLMDLDERRETYPNIENAGQVVKRILEDRYHLYIQHDDNTIKSGCPVAEDRQRNQVASDRAFISELAQRSGYVFFITPGDAPSAKSKAYFGPKPREGDIQPALSFNMGPDTNIESINFTYDGMRPVLVLDSHWTENDDDGGLRDGEVKVERHELEPRMSRQEQDYSEFTVGGDGGPIHVRKTLFNGVASSVDDAKEQAQAYVNSQAEQVVTAQGELDALRYGRLLKPMQRVGIRGVGHTFDGVYYVNSVSHRIRRGEYKQSFSLSREGIGTSVPVVRV